MFGGQCLLFPDTSVSSMDVDPFHLQELQDKCMGDILLFPDTYVSSMDVDPFSLQPLQDNKEGIMSVLAAST